MPTNFRIAGRAVALAIVFGSVCLLALSPGSVHSGPPILSTSTMTVDTTSDAVSLDNGTLSLREAIMLANGDLGAGSLGPSEMDNINASGIAPGAAASDSIIFDATVFPTTSTSLIPLGSALPVLDTGLDSVRGSGNTVGAGFSNVRIVGDGSGGAGSFDCFTIDSNSNSVRGVAVSNCKEAIKVSGDFNTIGGNNLLHRVTVFDNQQGVNLHGAAESTVENLVAYDNTIAGVTVGGASAQQNEVRASSIGISPADPSAGGNAVGVRVISSASDNVIGGSNSGGSATLVEGNVISGNGTGVRISGADTQSNEVIGNFIGTDLTGAAAEPNGIGVVLETGARFNSVGDRDPGEGNLISGNTTNGVDVNGASVNLIFANLIGTDSSGTAPLPNGGDGVLVRGGSEFISIGNDSDIPSRNVISGNQGAGVKFSGVGTSNNGVRLAFIGTDITGSQPIPNTIGVQIVAGASENSVGGATDERNIISGNIVGASINGSNSNTISANYFGTDVTGTEALPNGRGIVIDGGASSNTIGGTTPGRGNVISASNHGVAPHGIDLGSAHSNVIQGNNIGTDASGENPIPNLGSGIRLLSNTSNTLVGGTDAGAANLIAYNGSSGIVVSEFDPADPSRSHTISRNSIHSNGGLGIELSTPSGPNTNDDADPDVGANNLQNHPDLTSAGPAFASLSGPIIGPGPSTPVTGALNSTPNTDFRVEFFASDECDESGFGEGQDYVSTLDVTTDANGDADLSSNIAEVDAGRLVTATATNLTTGDTSEFSACVQVAGAATPTPTPSPTASPTPSATSTPTPTPTPTSPPANGLTHGDNDCDGDSDAVDALVSLQTNAGIDPNQQPGCPDIGAALPAGAGPDIFGDIDCDGDVDAVDALQILRNVAGLPVNANPGCPAIGDPL